VHVRHALQDLEGDVANTALGEVLCAVFSELVHVLVQEFEHEVQLVLLLDDL
jgi:hypothetical protein